MNSRSRSFAPPAVWGRFAILAAAVAVLLLGGGSVGLAGGNGTPNVGVTITSKPDSPAACLTNLSACPRIPYSTFNLDGNPAKPAYVSVSMTATNDSKNTLTHVGLAYPASCNPVNGACAPTAIPGATIAYVTGCPGATYPAATISCDFGSLVPGAVTPTVTVTLRTPPAAAGCGSPCVSRLATLAAFSANEGASDQQPQSSHLDTFTGGVDFALTSDTSGAYTSVTNPALTASTFGTDPSLAAVNRSATQASVPTRDFVPLGALVALGERSIAAGECPSSLTAMKLTCLPEVSQVSVDGAGLYTCTSGTVFDSTVCPGALDMSFATYSRSLPSGLKLSNFRVFHIISSSVTELVPLCSSGQTAPQSGDCVFGVTLDKSGLTYRVQGPGQGIWGGAG